MQPEYLDVVYVENIKEAEKIYEIWSRKYPHLKKWRGSEHTAVPFPKYIYLSNPKIEGKMVMYQSLGHGKFTPITYKKFMDKYGTTSKYVRQLNFESLHEPLNEENMSVEKLDVIYKKLYPIFIDRFPDARFSRMSKSNENVKKFDYLERFGDKDKNHVFYLTTVDIIDKKLPTLYAKKTDDFYINGVPRTLKDFSKKYSIVWEVIEKDGHRGGTIMLGNYVPSTTSKNLRQLNFESFLCEVTEPGQSVKKNITAKTIVVIKIKNEDESRKVQNFLFSKKIYWCDGDKEYFNIFQRREDSNYIMIEGREMTHPTNDYVDERYKKYVIDYNTFKETYMEGEE